jgi:hypothetical protein
LFRVRPGIAIDIQNLKNLTGKTHWQNEATE